MAGTGGSGGAASVPDAPAGFFAMSRYQPITVTPPASVEFRTLMNQNGYVFPVKPDDATIDALNAWSKQVLAKNPFAGLAPDQVPWLNLNDDSNKRDYVFISQEQMAYLVLLTLFGNDDLLPALGKHTGLEFTSKYSVSKNYLLFSLMTWLAALMKSSDYQHTYVGIAYGGLDQAAGMDLLTSTTNGPSLLEAHGMGGLNVCYFDGSSMLVKDDAAPLASEYCRQEKSLDDLGASFHSIDVPGQVVVDIGGYDLGGYTTVPGASLWKTQDESIPTFYPETIGWSFFTLEKEAKPKGTPDTGGKLYLLDKTAMFFGVRHYLEGLNGSKTLPFDYIPGDDLYGHTACGKPLGPAKSMLTQTVKVNLGGQAITLYDHSLVFVASQETLPATVPISLDSNYWTATRRLYSGKLFESNRWGLLNQNPTGGKFSSPLIDVAKWWSAFAPSTYHADVGDAFGKLVRRIGTFNWGAGAWWGDPEQYFLISWLGASLLDHVTLDYYVMSTSCENSGIQVALLKGQGFQQALALNQSSPNPLPAAWTPSNPPTQDIADVHALLRTRTVADALKATAVASQSSGVHVFDGIR